MGHSRITLATLLALGLLGTAQADEAGREPFFVELKGPDGAAPPVVQPQAQPVAPAQPAPRAQPMVRQAPSAAAGSYGPVRSTDTLWSLASKHRPSSRVTVYQTMVAIYDKNPRSFADGNINHILVGSRILLPSAAEAGRITDAEARRRFNSDNASWKGLSPKYLAEKQPHPVATKPAASAPVKAVAKAAPIPTAASKVSAPQAAAETKEVAKAQRTGAKRGGGSRCCPAAQSTTPAPLPPILATLVGKPSTEMALALEDANAQLGQVTEMNHRLKLRLQSLTEEVETLKAQLQDQTALQKEVAELKAKPVPPVVAPEPKQNWVMELLASPLNLAMIILLPVLLVLALVTLWLRARARRELEEQEKSLSESTSMVMGEESSEFDDLLSIDVTDNEPCVPCRISMTPVVTMAAWMHRSGPCDISSAMMVRWRWRVSSRGACAQSASRDPDLVPDLDLIHDDCKVQLSPAMDLGQRVRGKARASNEIMSEEELQAALFAELDADLSADLRPRAEPARCWLLRRRTCQPLISAISRMPFDEPTWQKRR
ncbi:FimV/HubP family polar landmark protein [Aeromonas sp. A-5]|uniref:FimV/HubP family polar landmark protein n=1 Tax=Aeromonas ichthyocola TaxID=3367746 RepID=UPI0038EE65C7